MTQGPTPEEIVDPVDGTPPPGADPWVDGARPEVGIAVVEYDAQWPVTYEHVRERIRAALGDRVLGLEHVGSTAVPGLAAKPVIDIDLLVADPDDEDAWLAPLQGAGFVLTVREPWWYGHRCLRGSSPRVNLHVFGPASPEPTRHRIFRDWLRSHPDEVALYAETKRRSARESNEAGEHTMEYNARKQSVVREIYARAFVAAGLAVGPLAEEEPPS